jgi:hypothetical protein
MITITDIKAELEQELSKANSEMEINMIQAEYNYRINKLEREGQDAYELAYIIPNMDKEEDCGCGEN